MTQHKYNADAASTDFVWLIDGHRGPVWALVDVTTRTVVALNPAPLDKTIRDLIGRRAS